MNTVSVPSRGRAPAPTHTLAASAAAASEDGADGGGDAGSDGWEGDEGRDGDGEALIPASLYRRYLVCPSIRPIGTRCCFTKANALGCRRRGDAHPRRRRGRGRAGRGRRGGGHRHSTLIPEPYTLNPKPSTLNPQPSTLNPQPSTLNLQP